MERIVRSSSNREVAARGEQLTSELVVEEVEAALSDPEAQFNLELLVEVAHLVVASEDGSASNGRASAGAGHGEGAAMRN